MNRARLLSVHIEDAKRRALAGWLAAHPQVTVDELVTLRKTYGVSLGGMSIAELSGVKALRMPSGAANATGLNQVQHAAARRARVLAALQSCNGWTAPKTLIQLTELSPVSLRRALRSLESQGKVSRKGKARATVWRAA